MSYRKPKPVVRRSDDLAPCGECPKGKCDHCDSCRYFVRMEATGWRVSILFHERLA